MLKQYFKVEHALSWSLLTVSIAMMSCSGNRQDGQEMPTPNVDFMSISQGATQIESKYPGTIEGSVNVAIKAQVTGYLERIHVNEGDFVSKGQILFTIKGDVYNEQVQNSRAALNAALSAQENAKIELEKIKPLVSGKVVSELQLRTAESNYKSASAQVAQAKAALGSSQINADFTQIKAPVSGYIGRIPNRIGNLVTPADPTPLTTLSEINNVFVYFSLSEADFIAFQRDRKDDAGSNTVELILADGSTYNHKGQIEVASGNIDRTTGSIALKAVFPNPEKALRAGGSGKVIIRKTLESSLTIPMSSVKDIQDRYFVYTLADSNKVVMKPIEIDGHSGNSYIIKSGLKSGEKIALNRIDVLREGMVVVPETSTKTSNQ